jgi:predicted ATP-grasp superfamily ATP-dependent carboligase
MSVNPVETETLISGNAAAETYREFVPRRGGGARIPAVIIGGKGPGTLGMVRSLSRADIPVILLDKNSFSPAMHSVYGHKVAISRLSGVSMVKDLLALAAAIAGPAVLFLNSDDAVLTVSEYRAELENHYRFRLPSHACLTSLIDKTSFQQMAEERGFPVPRSITIRHTGDFSRLAELRFPCIVKPTRGSANYIRAQFARGYKVTSTKQAEDVCYRILAVVQGLVVQEWIEGPDSDLYFCLQYRGTDGATVCSFTGRKLSIWPPDVGTTASCTVAPEARPILEPMTEAFFERVSFIGMGGIEFKRDARNGRFLMIEPTVGRIDAQEEVATLNGANIPLAAYLHEIGSLGLTAEADPPPVIWRDFFSHCMSVRGDRWRPAKPDTRVYDAYWRRDDPMPSLFHFLCGTLKALRRTLRRVWRKAY